MTLFRLLTEGTRALEQAGAPDAKQDAQQLLLAAFHLDLVHFLLNRMQELGDDSHQEASVRLYRDMIERRRKRCPLQQILGRQEFMGMEFKVNRHVLIPRQDTEALVERILEDTRDMAADRMRREEKALALLDVCTGSGCIAVSLAAKGCFGRVTATDISGEALKVAEENAERLLDGWQIQRSGDRPGADYSTEEKRVEFLQGDLFEALPGDGRRYDVIVSNPPYIPTKVIATLEPEVRDHEPVLALDGAEDGLAYYRRIAVSAREFLAPRGAVYVEIGCEQGSSVRGLFEAAGYRKVQIYKDLTGKDRVVKAGSEEGV